MAPFAAVLFLLVIFLMVGGLLPIPGVQVPLAKDLPGTDQPTIAIAVDAGGRYYFANQVIAASKLKSALLTAVHKSREPLTLVVHADKAVTYEQLVRLTLLAHEAQIQNVLLATLPGAVTTPVEP